jgi:hypothetical protein
MMYLQICGLRGVQLAIECGLHQQNYLTLGYHGSLSTLVRSPAAPVSAALATAAASRCDMQPCHFGDLLVEQLIELMQHKGLARRDSATAVADRAGS